MLPMDLKCTVLTIVTLTLVEWCEVSGDDGGVDMEERLGGREGDIVHTEQGHEPRINFIATSSCL